MIDPNSPDFQLIFQSLSNMILILSPEFNIVAGTDNYFKATLTKREEVVGRNMFEVFPDDPNDPDADGSMNLSESLNRVLKHGAPDNMAIQKYSVRKPGSEEFEERHWLPVNYPAFDKDKKLRYIIHSVEDVTEFVKLKHEGIRQHKLTEELRSRTDHMEKLRQSQRMEAMGQLAGGVAHDFNNILAIIMMNCDIMLEDGKLEDMAQKSFEQIKSTSARAAALTRQLLAFSRKQVLQPRTLNLNTVVSDIESMLKRLLNEDIQLKLKLEQNLGNTLADAGQIEQIILNLVINARDALPRGGNITIETANAVLDKSLAGGNPKVEPGNYIMLAIRDSGVGMDAETQARVFEPFFTTKGVGKGTGLGLATVYGIVSQNKGTIWVYSEPGKGTVFKIYLPLMTAEVTADEPVRKVEKLRGTEAVLVVEDQSELRDLVCQTLTMHGYQVTSCNNGLDAWNLIKDRPKDFRLVITDVVMPEMGGQALAQKMEKLNPDIRLLFLSGYTEDALSAYGVSGSHPHFLEKPFTLKSLLQKVRLVLDS